MGVPAGHTVVSFVVTQSEHDEIDALAKAAGMSKTQFLGAWFRSGAPEPLTNHDTLSVRSNDRELFVSLTRFLHGAGLSKGSRVHVSWGRKRLILTVK